MTTSFLNVFRVCGDVIIDSLNIDDAKSLARAYPVFKKPVARHLQTFRVGRPVRGKQTTEPLKFWKTVASTLELVEALEHCPKGCSLKILRGEYISDKPIIVDRVHLFGETGAIIRSYTSYAFMLRGNSTLSNIVIEGDTVCAIKFSSKWKRSVGCVQHCTIRVNHISGIDISSGTVNILHNRFETTDSERMGFLQLYPKSAISFIHAYRGAWTTAKNNTIPSTMTAVLYINVKNIASEKRKQQLAESFIIETM